MNQKKKNSPSGGETDKVKESNESKTDNGKVGSGGAEGSPESTSVHVRGNDRPSPGHEESSRQRAERVRAEQRRLTSWAEKNGKLKGKLPREDARGGEHIVQFDEKTGRVTKATRTDSQLGYGIAYGSNTQGATPSEYLDRIELQNEIFDDDVKVERVVKTKGGPSIVTSQPFIKGAPAEIGDIDSYMSRKGFEKIGQGAYHRRQDGILVHDVFPKNAVKSTSGRVHPIDPVIQRVDDDFADFLKNHYFRHVGLGLKARLAAGQYEIVPAAHAKMATQMGVPAAWLNPLRDLLAEIETKVADKTLTDSELQVFLDQAIARVPELFKGMDVPSLVKIFEVSMGAAVVDEVRRGIKR